MYNQFSSLLIDWYNHNKRDLPWRETSNPYLIWVSEVILQQTRVEQGLEYFYRFVNQFPTLEHLANAEEEEVLKLWQGLGYYSRARNMHKAAKLVVDNHHATFPRDYDDVISLPGIGDYTAAAICSFAYNQYHAVVDGNVYRVLSRVFGIRTPIDSSNGKTEFQIKATSVLNRNFPSHHNQAIMEFGALQCVPKNPNCTDCPMKIFCQANINNEIDILPIKQKKSKIRNRYFNYLVCRNADLIYLQKREKDDVWKNLYDFPLIETTQEISLEELLELSEFKQMINQMHKIHIKSEHTLFKHKLTHQTIYAKFWEIQFDHIQFENWIPVVWSQIQSYPTSKLIENYLMSIL